VDLAPVEGISNAIGEFGGTTQGISGQFGSLVIGFQDKVFGFAHGSPRLIPGILDKTACFEMSFDFHYLDTIEC